MRRTVRAFAVLTAVAALFATVPTYAIEGGGIDTVFSIRKSTNENAVDYGIMLDAQCHPRTDEPVVGYFRRGTGSTRELSMVERTIYGVRGQRITQTANGGTVDFHLRAVSDRAIRISASRNAAGACVAHAITRVNGERSLLVDIYVVLTGPRSVDHIEVTGRTISGSRTVREDIRQ